MCVCVCDRKRQTLKKRLHDSIKKKRPTQSIYVHFRYSHINNCDECNQGLYLYIAHTYYKVCTQRTPLAGVHNNCISWPPIKYMVGMHSLSTICICLIQAHVRSLSPIDIKLQHFSSSVWYRITVTYDFITPFSQQVFGDCYMKWR